MSRGAASPPPARPGGDPAKPAADGTPDFVGVGVQKSGTSSAADLLAQHPGIVMRRKEIDFFVRHFHRGWKWYESFFDDKQGRIAGELSVNYLYAPRRRRARLHFYPDWNPIHGLRFWRDQGVARDELARRYPALRVFAVFRDPAERAWSHYWFWRRRRERNGKRVVAFERMFEDDGRWIRTQGEYADHVAAWRERFPGLGIFFYDDLLSDPAGFARALYAFVGADPGFAPDLGRHVNPGDKEPLPPGVRRRLVEHYADQIRRFAQASGRDLSAWLR